MNLRKLRRVFGKLSESVTIEGRKGVLALANVGDTQSHAQEILAEKLAELPKASRPTCAVFWHHQSHARAFDAEGELVAKLVLHWVGARTHIAAALTTAFANEADVKLTLASRDELAFAIVPKAVKSAKSAKSANGAKKTGKSGSPATAPKERKKGAKTSNGQDAAASSSAKFDGASFQVSKLKDAPETHALLVRGLREGDGRAALAALVVLMRFAQQRDDKEAAKRRKAGTEAAFYAELDQRPGLFSEEAIEALLGNARAVCEALEEKNELALRLAVRQAMKVAHRLLAPMLEAAQAASPWRTRRVLAELGQLPGATLEVLHGRLSALLGDETTDVVSTACKSLAVLERTSQAAVMIELLLRDAARPRVRDWLFWSLAHSPLSPAERAKARPLAARPAFAANEHRLRFLKTTT